MSSALLLTASLIALVLAPLLYRWARAVPGALAALDGFVFVSIAGLTIGHVLPETVELAGWGTLLAALLGMIGPLLVERWIHRAAERVHETALGLALLGVLAHAVADGMALSGVGHHGGEGVLPVAVLVHRLPVALTVWSLLATPYGVTRALGVLAVIGVGTVAGFGYGGGATAGWSATWLGYFQALVAGSLLHVVIHSATHDDAEAARPFGWHLPSGIGALLGLGLVFALGSWEVGGHAHEAAEHGGVVAMLSAMALESAPALVLAYLVSGLVHVYLPKAGLKWLGGGSRAAQATKGVAFGLPLPMCSCGVIPVYRSLVVGGVPATAGMAFFVATPELGLDAIFLSIPLLGPEITAARVVAAVVVALVVGLVVGGMASRQPVTGSRSVDDEPLPVGAWPRLREALRVGYGEMVDATIPWIILGLVIAAVLDPVLRDPDSLLSHVPGSLEVALFAVLGMPAYVCASGATPLVAILVAHGVSPGAAVAFLLTGPATNVTTFGVLSELHGKRIAAAFGLAIAVSAVAIGHVINIALPLNIEAPVGHLHTDGAGWLRIGSLGILILLTVLSLLRQGPREFVANIVTTDDHDHDHDHDGHDHDGHDHTGHDEAPNGNPAGGCCP